MFSAEALDPGVGRQAGDSGGAVYGSLSSELELPNSTPGAVTMGPWLLVRWWPGGRIGTLALSWAALKLLQGCLGEGSCAPRPGTLTMPYGCSLPLCCLCHHTCLISALFP